MHLRRHILPVAVALMALVAGRAQASTKHPAPESRDSRAVRSSATHDPRAAALVAWKPRAWTPATANALQGQGLRVAIDPVDGTMSMPAAGEPEQMMIGDDAPVQIDRAADGTLTAHLDERWSSFAVVAIGPDGVPGWTCVQGRQGAAKFMMHPVAPVISKAPKWEDK